MAGTRRAYVIGTDRPGHDLGREAFGTASGLAIVVGALAVVSPPFGTLTATLVVLALAGWASAHRRAYGGLASVARSPGTFGAAFAALAAASIVFAAAPTAFVPWRALLLGLAVVPLWGAERRRPAGRPQPGRPP
jgi:hypothetical protein